MIAEIVAGLLIFALHAVSPHDLTDEEAALIASRMPAPYGEKFLSEGIEPKRKRMNCYRRIFLNPIKRRRWH